ncbi:hypothetical protein H7Y40_01955 [Pedobacter sp.]|nr:hypothetical protein [Candidatus Saccharibacteria bacterium]
MSNTGEPIWQCSDAPPYEDYAVPPSKDICIRRAESAIIHMADPYKRQYLEQSRALDIAVADTRLTLPQLNERFRSIEEHLDRLVDADEVDIETGMRLEYHINARLLKASLGVYFHQAVNPEEPMEESLMITTHQEYIEVLSDFYDGPYANLSPELAAEIAYKRTEIEVITLLSRKYDSSDFPVIALAREENSMTRANNHDSATYDPIQGKTPIQVKTSSSYIRSKKRGGDAYSPSVVMAIHNDIVELGREEGGPILHVVQFSRHEEETPFTIPYEEYDPEIGIRWYAESQQAQSQEIEEEPFEFIQEIGGHKKDSLIAAIVNESRGEHLTLEERNRLNGATHYLSAALNAARRHKASLVDEEFEIVTTS